ncbi:hypothetical protein [Sorangium sp. So ce233]|uniref:hypothetical protein n=1 Tax=Sorangium sp. So ce233 TaxID=3133290 RepID=UPI003F61EE5E
MSKVRDGLKICCAAAVTLAAVQAGATEPPPGSAPQVSPAPPGPLAPAAPTAAQPLPLPSAAVDAPPAPLAPPAGEAAGVSSSPPAGAAGYPPPPHGWRAGAWQTASGGVGAKPQVQRVWYGWQHLLVLGGSLVLVPVALSAEAPEILLLSYSGLLLGGPIVHSAHEHVGKSLASLGLNVGGTLVGGFIGAANAGRADEGDWVNPKAVAFILGGSLGLLAANIVDIAALPYEEKVRKPESHVANRLRLAPQIGFAPRGATFGLGGTF